MFRPNVAIIRFTSESTVVVLYRIGMGMSLWLDLIIGLVWLCHDGEISASVMFVICYL